MEMTLRKVLKLCHSKKTIEELKVFLQGHKKKGTIFIRENISAFEPDEKFEFYYFLMPSRVSTIDAFPIPISDFEFKEDIDQQCDLYKFHFEKYYRTIKFKRAVFQQYSAIPYVGTDHIWLYKNI
jgi:hypothetical protein